MANAFYPLCVYEDADKSTWGYTITFKKVLCMERKEKNRKKGWYKGVPAICILFLLYEVSEADVAECQHWLILESVKEWSCSSTFIILWRETRVLGRQPAESLCFHFLPCVFTAQLQRQYTPLCSISITQEWKSKEKLTMPTPQDHHMHSCEC